MLQTELEKVCYSLGVNIARSMQQQGMIELDSNALKSGIEDVFNNCELKIAEIEGQQLLQNYFQKLQEKQFERNIIEGKAFLEENSKKAGVITLESGLQYSVVTVGNGPKPKITDTVTTHYHGMLIDGTVFDSSIERGQPASFPVNGVIRGWVEALQLMTVGSKWKLYIPSDLAYGANPRPGGPIEPHMVLIFDIELISVS